MRIEYLLIRNFKSIRELEINDIEDVLILVGRNNAGKSVVLDAIRAVTGDYEVSLRDFNDNEGNKALQFASVLKMRIWLYCIRRDRSVLLSIMTCGIRIFAINCRRLRMVLLNLSLFIAVIASLFKGLELCIRLFI